MLIMCKIQLSQIDMFRKEPHHGVGGVGGGGVGGGMMGGG